MKKKRPQFFAIVKNCNNGKIEHIDVLLSVWDYLLTEKGNIKKSGYAWKGETIESLYDYVDRILMSQYWSRCQYEFIVIDWPYRDKVDTERDGDNVNIIDINKPVKIDVYDQLKPNMDVIVNMVWDYVKDKIRTTKVKKIKDNE